tara:strand:- start:5253 stop:5471 length:219 start_codon:yes stop_codon:yes gene_type:complete
MPSAPLSYLSVDTSSRPSNGEGIWIGDDTYCKELLETMLKTCSKDDVPMCNSIIKVYEGMCMGNEPNSTLPE